MGPRAGSAAGGRLDGTLRAFAVRHGWEVRRVMSEDFVQLGSNVYKVVAGTEPDHLAAARALLAGGGLIGAETEASARDDYRSSLASYAPEEGVPPESEAVVALRKQVTVTLSAMAVERDALLAALRGAQANERRALARVAELEAIYEPHGATLAVAVNPEPESDPQISKFVEATFTEPGTLGLKLNEYDPGDGSQTRAVVVKLNPGTQVEQHPQLRKGLLLERVGAHDVRTSSYSEVLSLLRTSKQRPITLRFTEQDPRVAK